MVTLKVLAQSDLGAFVCVVMIFTANSLFIITYIQEVSVCLQLQTHLQQLIVHTGLHNSLGKNPTLFTTELSFL